MSINDDLRSHDGIPIDQLIGLLLEFPSDRRVRINREMLIIRDPTTRSCGYLDDMNPRDPIISAEAARRHLAEIDQIPEYKIFTRTDLIPDEDQSPWPGALIADTAPPLLCSCGEHHCQPSVMRST